MYNRSPQKVQYERDGQRSRTITYLHTYLNASYPIPQPFFFLALSKHHPWRMRAGLEVDGAIVFLGCFGDCGDFFARGHVVGFYEGAVMHG